MLLLGIDLGTSSVKVSVVDADTQTLIASCHYPENEADIISSQPSWAEQSPELWWEYVQQAILKCNSSRKYDPKMIVAIGIAYQMHGLVLVDNLNNVLRNSIIWCDSRAVEIGETAFTEIGTDKCLSHLLNSPGNFTASKLAWVKDNEPGIYEKINKFMLPGDFISLKLTGEITTTISALSEGIFWDFKNNNISEDITGYFGFDQEIFPETSPLFSAHGYLMETVASKLSLTPGIPVTYKAGDQLNNALFLNVLKPGEIAATAGTSGVIYGVGDTMNYDPQSRINSFAHVNYTNDQKRIGVLLCINGAGIFNRWVRNIVGPNISYNSLNDEASKIEEGSNGLITIPFGNGAERMLNNQVVGAHFHNLDLNIHSTGHMVRAVQEGIAFAFRYGIDIMRENGIEPHVIRAGKTNLFLSDVFTHSFVNATNTSIEFYEGDGSFGAAIGAGIGLKIYDIEDPFKKRNVLTVVEPGNKNKYDDLYGNWKELLNEKMALHSEQQKILFA